MERIRRAADTAGRAAMAAMTLLYLPEVLAGLPTGTAAGLAGAVVLAVRLPVMGKTFRTPAWVFFLAGAGILLAAGAPVSQWLAGLGSMLKTAVILIVMQGLSLAMSRGGYQEAVGECLGGGAGSPVRLFCMVMLLAHLLASVMSLGSVVVILAAIAPALRGEGSRRFLAAAVSWGYCTLFLWAPGTVTVLMSMQVFGLSWQSYFPPALLLSLLGLGLGAVLAGVLFRREARAAALPAGAGPSREAWGKVGRLAGVLLIIVAGITVLERLGFGTSTGRLLAVTLAVSALWLLAQGRRPGMPSVLRAWWEEALPRNGDLSCFFLAMGVFSGAVQYAGLAQILTDFCQSRQGLLGPLVLPLVPAVVVLFSLVGLHPFVSVLIIGPILAEAGLPASPLQLGLAMSLGCCLSYMLSPFAGLILALSGGLEEPPARICVRSNLAYALLYYAAAMVVIWFLPG